MYIIEDTKRRVEEGSRGVERNRAKSIGPERNLDISEEES